MLSLEQDVAAGDRDARMGDDVKNTISDLLLKAVAILLGGAGFSMLFWGLAESAGAFRAFFGMLGFFVAISTAVGFVRYRGWAFLVASVALLVGYFATFIRMILAFNRHETDAGRTLLIAHVVVIVLIGFIGRWSIEKRFRPHLDIDDHA